MRNKGIIFFFVLSIIAALTSATASEKCVHWKKVCHPTVICVQQERTQNSGCYRCLKPSEFNFHAYAQLVDRTTCSDRTADYLRTMGYRCYHPYAPTHCVKTQEKENCERVCLN